MPFTPLHRTLLHPLLLSGARLTVRTGFPFVLALACRSPQTATEEEPVRAVTTAAPQAKPKVTIQDTSNQKPDAAVAASSVTRNVECMGGERRLTYSRRIEANGANEVELKFSAAGHRAWSYQFHYLDGSLQRIEHRVTSWRFSDDSSGAPSTQDTVLERRYQLTEGKTTGHKATNCIAARASGPTATIESQLSKAKTAAIACSDAERVLALASQLNLEARVPDNQSLTTACAVKDPSSGMKL